MFELTNLDSIQIGLASPEKIRESYENTLNQLRDLSKGLLRLPGVERKSTAVNSSLAIAPSSGESVFSMMLQDS